MSTDYVSSELITVSDLLGGRLEKYGVTNSKSPNANEGCRSLADGENNYLWVYGERFVECFTRYMPTGWPGFMLQAIANEFDVEIFSEHDEDTSSYVPLGKPTEVEISAMRSEWRTECEELDRELEEFRAKRREERTAVS